jgi:hydrogenase maturation protease
VTGQAEKILLIGYGNPGRLDDGLGPALAEEIRKAAFTDVTVDADYQLTVEDAAEVAVHDIVIFADASVNGCAPFSFGKIEPRPSESFSSHSVEPEAVLALARDLFGAKTQGYVMGIRGYHFDGFGEELSREAKENLGEAVQFISGLLARRDFGEINARGVNPFSI